MLQPLTLFYTHNIVTKSFAYIFVSTTCNGDEYQDAVETGAKAKELFGDIFEFDEVKYYQDIDKWSMRNILNKIITDA